MLEDLTLTSPGPYHRSRLPETFSAPRLRHLYLVQVGDVFVEGIPLLASVTGLVKPFLEGTPSPTSFPSRITPLTHASTRVLVPRVRRLRAGSL